MCVYGNDEHNIVYIWGFPSGSADKNAPAVQETWVRSLGWEDALEEGMVTHSSILAWKIPWTEEPGGLSSMGLQELDMTEVTEHAHILRLTGKTSLILKN